MHRNYTRKSTKGWSIFNIIADFTGGSLSFLQIVLDDLDKGTNLINTKQTIQGDVDIFGGGLNIVKFGLSIISMCFDVIFLWQHYVLYP